MISQNSVLMSKLIDASLFDKILKIFNYPLAKSAAHITCNYHDRIE